LASGASFPLPQLRLAQGWWRSLFRDGNGGRVMSYYTMAIVGMAPFGSLLSGWLAARIGAPLALAIGGACCVAGAGIFALRLGRIRELVHPIYVRLGIVPEIAEGLNSAAMLSSVSEE
jgi:hypothetical protein